MLENYLRIFAYLVLCVVGIVYSYKTLKPEAERSSRSSVGSKFQPLVESASAHSTVLIVLSTNCRYCRMDAPFLQKLTESLIALNRKDLLVLAVLPEEKSEAEAFVHGSFSLRIDTASLIDVGIFESIPTPTILVLDRSHKVVRDWVGLTPTEKQAATFSEILKAVQNARG